jgi:hypothetical protein
MKFIYPFLHNAKPASIPSLRSLRSYAKMLDNRGGRRDGTFLVLSNKVGRCESSEREAVVTSSRAGVDIEYK